MDGAHHFVFEHIYKTAGTTFNLSYLPAAFPPEQLYIVSGYLDTNQASLDKVAALGFKERARLRVIAGHNTGQLRHLYSNARYLTLVRSPVDRMVSAYLHSRYHQDAWDPIGREIHEKNISLAEFVQRDLTSEVWADWLTVHNGQAKVVLGAAWEHDWRAGRAAIQERIRSRFYLVGYTEAFELFLYYLHVTEGFPLVLFHNRLVRKERKTFYVTARDVAAIEGAIAADRMVYECARQEFDRKVAEIWNEEHERAYALYLEALEEFRALRRKESGATALYRNVALNPPKSAAELLLQ